MGFNRSIRSIVLNLGILASSGATPYIFVDPSSITGGELWLDTSDAGTITEVSGSVSQWDDKFPSGNNAVQATGSQQPITNSRTLNSLNVLDFDRASSQLMKIPGYVVDNSKSYTFVVVMQSDDVGNVAAAISQWGAGVNRTMHMSKHNTEIIFTSMSNTGAAGVTTVGSNSAIISMLKYDKGGSPSNEVIIDGSSASSSTPALPEVGVVGEFTIGAFSNEGNSWDGLIAEIIIYPFVLDATQTSDVTGYLNTKWSIY